MNGDRGGRLGETGEGEHSAQQGPAEAPNATPRISIVIPTLDEERAIAGCLAELGGLADEIVVSDGGSTDGTLRAVEKAGAVIVTGPPGRGTQLNRGAASATGDVLLFLHADTRLPDSAAEDIRRTLAAGAEGGGFSVEFASDRRLMRLGTTLVNLRTRFTRAPLGDQAQFCRRDAFEELGGFRDWPILEDLDFIRRLKRRGRLVVLDSRVRTSARRFLQRGAFRTIGTNWLIWALYFLGVSPRRLSRLYRVVR